MYLLRTIREVFAFNVKELRGSRSQEDVADATGIPWSTYQTYEYGTIPQKHSHLEALAKFHGVPETRFFLDPDLTKPSTNQVIEAVTQSLLKTENTQKTPIKQPEIEELVSILSTLNQPELTAQLIRIANDTRNLRSGLDSDHNKKDGKKFFSK